MPFELYPAFSVPFAQDFVPNPEGLNAQLKSLLLTREKQGGYANPNPSLKQQPGVFESDFNLFSWPDACVQQLRQFCWTVLGRTIQELSGCRSFRTPGTT